MKRWAILLAPVLMMPQPASAQPEGRLDTLRQGEYRCALPGVAGGQPWVRVPDMDFVIENGSSYAAANGRGTYLATRERVTFTRGPLKGERFQRRGTRILVRLAPDGTAGRLRCVRAG